MNHLTPGQIDDLRAELLGQLRKLERSMRATDETLEPVTLDQTAVGRLSRVDALQTQELARNLQERERLKLGQIEEALKRLDEGSYGICVTCGAAIPFERLHVFPEAPTCAACGEA